MPLLTCPDAIHRLHWTPVLARACRRLSTITGRVFTAGAPFSSVVSASAWPGVDSLRRKKSSASRGCSPTGCRSEPLRVKPACHARASQPSWMEAGDANRRNGWRQGRNGGKLSGWGPSRSAPAPARAAEASATARWLAGRAWRAASEGLLETPLARRRDSRRRPGWCSSTCTPRTTRGIWRSERHGRRPGIGRPVRKTSGTSRATRSSSASSGGPGGRGPRFFAAGGDAGLRPGIGGFFFADGFSSRVSKRSAQPARPWGVAR